MYERELYDVLREHLETSGYYPVKKEPAIRIRGYKPDVTGLKGKEVQCIEAKPALDEHAAMAAVTQARVYQFGSTHTYVALPSRAWQEAKKELISLLERLCRDANLGIYLVDLHHRKVEQVCPAQFSPNLSLDDYDSVVRQLEGTEWVALENTKPEYLADICALLSAGSRVDVGRKQLHDMLREEFPSNEYWLLESRSSASKERAALNRITSSVKASVELGFIEIVEPDKDGIEEQDKLRLSYSGRMLAQCRAAAKDRDKPTALNEKTVSFLSAYLVKLPVVRMAVESLSERGGRILLGQSRCRNEACKFTHWVLDKSRGPDGRIVCPKCGSDVHVCLVHQLEMEHGGGRNYWWPIHFTKSLDIFSFPRVSRLLGVELKAKPCTCSE